MARIELNHFNFTYPLGDRPALTGVNLEIEPGEFLVICGASGSGKSTLLHCLKKAVTPAGTVSGVVSGLPADTEIAIVFQNPETQLVTATVINDLAFQMENRGVDSFIMKKRMSETVSFMGLEELLHKPTAILSGGQKQLVALCAALMCEPQLLLLDEPVSQLDPLSATAFLEMLRKINTELGVTVIMAEHRLDECTVFADRIVFMENGSIRYTGSAADTLTFLYKQNRSDYVPQLPRASLYIDGRVALTPRAFRAQYPHAKRALSEGSSETNTRRVKEFSIKITDAAVRYGKTNNTPFILNRLSLSCETGEFLCVLGGNGSGKSTLLKLIAGILKPYMGRVRTDARKIGYMPQQVRDYFLYERVGDEYAGCDETHTCLLIERLGIDGLSQKHPYDLSGGEQQKVVLAAILSGKPDLIVLDEPTKGMDPDAKRTLAELLRETGKTVIMATHDLEFAAQWADRCVMLFDGEIVYTGEPRVFFTGNRYYTTALHKGLHHIDKRAFVMRDVYELWD